MMLVAYTRLSKDEKTGRQVGLDVQRAKIEAYAELYGHQVDSWPEDHASGKDLKRPGLTCALDSLQAGRVEGLVVYKLDRLTRSGRDMYTLLDRFFGHGAKHPRSLLSVSDQIDTSTAMGRFVLSMTVSISQWERETIGERTCAALAEKKAQGVVLGRPRKPITDPTRIEDLLRIRAWKDRGMTFETIATRLNDQNRRPWGSATSWEASSVRYTLNHATLEGEAP